MNPFRPTSRRLPRKVRAVAAVFQLALFALVAPMLVVCEDGNRHAAVESALLPCCDLVPAGPGGTDRASQNRGMAENGCEGSCTYTLVLAGIDVPSTRSVAQGLEVLAVTPAVAPAPYPDPAFASTDEDGRPVSPSPHLGRSTVLLI